MSFEAAYQTFIAESVELLQDMEDKLLGILEESDRTESINSIFRAAHTIKGSGGLFGLTQLVEFTHVVESVLDRVRSNQLELDQALVTLLLQCKDYIGSMVEALAAGNQDMETVDHAVGEQLVKQLSVHLEDTEAKTQIVADLDKRLEQQVGSDYQVGSGNWHISMRCGPDMLRNGMDPISFIRFLATMGEIKHVETTWTSLPPLEEMDPETSYLGFDINLKSEAAKSTIEGVFEFIRELCWIAIFAPHSFINDFITAIESMPEKDLSIGDILVACGSITHRELNDILETQRAMEDKILPLGEIAIEAGIVRPEVVEAALHKQESVKKAASAQKKFIRIDADKLDKLVDLIGELVIASAGVSIESRGTHNAILREASSTLSRLVEEVRDGVLELRMVEIGETFNRFQRVVRDVSMSLGKEIDLIVNGGDTELDKSVVEKIGDPLTHLVRNSMDHGIEPADTRVTSGKPAKGTLRLNAYHDSGSIVIEVADDGGGLNRDKIFAKAVERGLVQANASMTDKEVYQLIFEAGFSTADKVSDLSGRGVGMDVVRRNIESLRGNVELDSVPGKGTTVRIRLPLTLAIIDGFLVRVAESSFVIPLEMVLECVELSSADREQIKHKSFINLRGEVLPFIRLRDEFQLESPLERRENIVIVQYAGHKAGFVVDQLLGEFQTVIKPLGKIFSGIRGISGSTILGTGEVALILDVPSMVNRASTKEALRLAESKAFNI
jgi:two-component system chemotaxis sensor kinase CheA